MSKRSIFTTVTPLPSSVSRATVLGFLHDYEAIIDLNPLVTDRHRIPAPANAEPDEALRVWYRLTDAIAMPWSSSSKHDRDPAGSRDKQRRGSSSSSSSGGGGGGTSVSYTCVFHPLVDGLQTHCRAPLGVDIRERWTVAGTLPGEPRQPVELGLAGLGAPAVGLYLREDVDLRCNHLMAGFVKKTLKRSHASLVAHLASLAAADGAVERRDSNSIITAATLPPGGTARRNSAKSDKSTASLSAIPSSFLAPRLPSPVPSPPQSTAGPPSSTPTSPYQLPRNENQVHPRQQQQHRPRFPVHRYHASLDSPQPAAAPPAALRVETQQLDIAPPAPQPRQLPSEEKSKTAHPEHLLLQPHTYDAGSSNKDKSATASAASRSGRKNGALYPEPLRVPKQQSPPRTQPTPSHPDYPVMNPYDDGLDSPVIGRGDDKTIHHQLPVFVELAADSEMQLVPVMLDTGRARSRSRN